MDGLRYRVRLAVREGKLLGWYEPAGGSARAQVGSVIELKGRPWRVVAIASDETGQLTLAVRPAAT